MDELALLVAAAGGEVAGRMVQSRDRVDAATFIGKGKTQELADLCQSEKATLAVFDEDLSPAQVKNLEKALGCRVTDRTGVILDIFARRARSREAKTQVELAQYNYLLPRLTKAWAHLSRQAGGIGTRGVGETQLETDRRVIRRRIAALKRSLDHIASRRDVQRRSRKETYAAALVGYTNAGKSSLLNRLSAADVAVENRPFSTLDTTFRRLPLDGFIPPVVLIDTVGLVRKLPHHLVASFRSTLEQAREASVILHVVDVSHPEFDERAQTALEVLAQLELGDVPILTVLNKVDVAPPPLLARAANLYPEGLPVSAVTGGGLRELKAAITKTLLAAENAQYFFVPFESWPEARDACAGLRVLSETYLPEGVRLWVTGNGERIEALRRLIEAHS